MDGAVELVGSLWGVIAFFAGIVYALIKLHVTQEHHTKQLTSLFELHNKRDK
jgi:hypothetical protein